MPIGIVADNEFDLEVDNISHDIVISKPIINIDKFDSIFGDDNGSNSNKGRGKGNVEVPEVLRKVIAGEVIEGGNVSEVSKAFDVSRSSISAYIKGAHSTTTYDNHHPELTKHNGAVRDKIVRLTRSKLRKSIRFITDDKLASCNAVQLAVVASHMSKIVNDNDPVEVSKSEFKQSVVIYRPRIREEDSFEVISVSE